MGQAGSRGGQRYSCQNGLCQLDPNGQFSGYRNCQRKCNFRMYKCIKKIWPKLTEQERSGLKSLSPRFNQLIDDAMKHSGKTVSFGGASVQNIPVNNTGRKPRRRSMTRRRLPNLGASSSSRAAPSFEPIDLTVGGDNDVIDHEGDIVMDGFEKSHVVPIDPIRQHYPQFAVSPDGSVLRGMKYHWEPVSMTMSQFKQEIRDEGASVKKKKLDRGYVVYYSLYPGQDLP